MRPVVLGLLAVGMLAGRIAVAAPIHWTVNGHYYEFVPSGVQWADARAAALASRFMGSPGYLATVTSREEFDFIFNSVTRKSPWIGGTDEVTEGVWTWADGPEAGQIFFGPGAVEGAFAPWVPGEPNDCCGGEDYLATNYWLHAVLGWNDTGGPGLDGDKVVVDGYIIEYNSIPQPGTLALLGLGLAGLGLSRRRIAA